MSSETPGFQERSVEIARLRSALAGELDKVERFKIQQQIWQFERLNEGGVITKDIPSSLRFGGHNNTELSAHVFVEAVGECLPIGVVSSASSVK